MIERDNKTQFNSAVTSRYINIMLSIKLNFDLFLLILLTYFVDVIKCQDFEVPPARVEPLYPKGLRVSIPDSEGLRLFAFHGNANVEFEHGLEAGQMSVDVLRKRNDRWTYTNRDIKLKIGDTVHYWLYVIRDPGYRGYNRLFQSHVVTEFFDESGKSVGSGGSPASITPPSMPPTPPPTMPPTPPPTMPPTTPPTTLPPQLPSAAPYPPKVVTETDTIRPSSCIKSVTTVKGLENQCKDALIFQSNFNNLITNEGWSHVIEFGENEQEFTILDNNPNITYTDSGSLVIKPVFLDHIHGSGFVLSGLIDLNNRCTSTVQGYCRTVSRGSSILPPVMSARLSTKDHFTFRYGTVEVKAKLPRGDWVVPEIWLLPKQLSYGPQNSGKIVLGKSFGNNKLMIDGLARGNIYFYSGLEVGNQTFKYDKSKSSSSFADNFHLFKVIWDPVEISFYFDNQQIGRWSINDGQPLIKEALEKNAPFDKEFYLVLGVHVGGTSDFPDGIINNGRVKPWENEKSKRLLTFYNDSGNWLKTWDDETTLRVEHVKVWAL